MLARIITTMIVFSAAISMASAQDIYFGALFSYHVSLLSAQGESEGGLRSGAGLLVSLPIGKTSEFRMHAMYRVESGQFKTMQATQTPEAAQASGSADASQLDVIVPGTKPYISSDITLRGIEIGASYWLNVVKIDTMGTNFFVGAGLFADRILSGEQVDNYAFADVLPGEPVERTYQFAGQFGGGGFLGASLVFPIGAGRLGFDLVYAIRMPSEIGSQNIEWLNGRCIRLAAHYDFAL